MAAPSKDQLISWPYVETANSSTRPGAGEIAAKPTRTSGPAGAPTGRGSTLRTQVALLVVRQRKASPAALIAKTSVTLLPDDTAAGAERGRLRLSGRGAEPRVASALFQE
jgi:hypothetical protein